MLESGDGFDGSIPLVVVKSDFQMLAFKERKINK